MIESAGQFVAAQEIMPKPPRSGSAVRSDFQAAADLAPFTGVIDAALGMRETRLGKHHDYGMRMISGLLHLSHSDTAKPRRWVPDRLGSDRGLVRAIQPPPGHWLWRWRSQMIRGITV